MRTPLVVRSRSRARRLSNTRFLSVAIIAVVCQNVRNDRRVAHVARETRQEQ